MWYFKNITHINKYNFYNAYFQVSAIGVLFLAGLYISAMSACLGALYATPRIIQSMANENVIPIMKFLGKGVIVSILWLQTFM